MLFDTTQLDRMRRDLGYLTVEETLRHVKDNVVLDPFSLLIGRGVVIGSRNVFYPNVTMTLAEGGAISIADRNTFHSGMALFAGPGRIAIGSGNQFGEGGFTAKANRDGASIEIGDHGRYLGGAAVYGETRLGSGSQILGAIAADNCTLGAGAAYHDPDPDARGAVLKGFGSARGLTLACGQVILGSGVFDAKDVKPQWLFHR